MRRYFTCEGGTSRITGRNKKCTKAKEGKKLRGKIKGAESAKGATQNIEGEKREEEKG